MAPAGLQLVTGPCMRVEVAEDAEALAGDAAAWVARAAREAVAARGRFTAAFSGGGTPIGMFEQLAVAGVPWSSVVIFQVDERVAPDGHADRNLTALRRHLVEPAGVPEGNVHPMPVTSDDLEAAAARYGATLEAVCGIPPVLDLVHLGIGDDGHTASLVPGDEVLNETDREVAVTSVYRGRRRMTLTYPPLARARTVLWLVADQQKATALGQLLDGDRSVPAGCVPQDNAVVLTDRAAYRAAGRQRSA